MKLCVMFCLIALCKGEMHKRLKMKDTSLKSVPFANGVEFNQISRRTLLKILAAFEESINSRMTKNKVRPVFTAQFANNKFSRPYIYPNVFKKPENN